MELSSVWRCSAYKMDIKFVCTITKKNYIFAVTFNGAYRKYRGFTYVSFCLHICVRAMPPFFSCALPVLSTSGCSVSLFALPPLRTLGHLCGTLWRHNILIKLCADIIMLEMHYGGCTTFLLNTIIINIIVGGMQDDFRKFASI